MSRVTFLLLLFNIGFSNSSRFNYNLPSDFPEISINLNNSTSSSHIFLSAYTDVYPLTYNYNYMMILNSSGNLIFFKKTNGQTHDFKPHPNGQISYFVTKPNYMRFAYIMDNTYTVVDSFSSQNYWMDDHELQLLENGNFLFLARNFRTMDLSEFGGLPAAQVEDYIIQELDSNKNIVFEWNSADYFDIHDAPHIDITAQHIYYVHANAVEIDMDGNLLLSSRHMDEITKINRQNGDIIWRLGGINNQFTFINENIGYEHSIPTPFCHQHDIRRLENGNITLFDNGNYKNPKLSRMVEYELDEINMTATLVWEYSDSIHVYAPMMGNAQRLPNGNTIGVWNSNWWDGEFYPNAVIEVDQNSTKVFELSIQEIFSDEGAKTGFWNYRALRGEWVGQSIKPYLWANPVVDSLELNFVKFGDEDISHYNIYLSTNEDMFIIIDSTSNNKYQFQYTILEDTNYFRVSSTDFLGNESPLSNKISYINGSLGIYDSDLNSKPRDWLFQNNPNPFNNVTTISYSQSTEGNTIVSIYDMLGREIKTIINNSPNLGYKTVHWDAKDNKGHKISSGIYLYRIKIDNFIQTKKMIYLK